MDLPSDSACWVFAAKSFHMCSLTCSISRGLLYPLLPAMLSPRLLCLSCIICCCEELCCSLACAVLWWLIVLHTCEQLKFTYEGIWPLSNSWAMSTHWTVQVSQLNSKKWIEYGNWKQYAAVTNKYICFLKTMYFKMNRCQNTCVRNCVLFDSFETNVMVYFIYYVGFLRKTWPCKLPITANSWPHVETC